VNIGKRFLRVKQYYHRLPLPSAEGWDNLGKLGFRVVLNPQNFCFSDFSELLKPPKAGEPLNPEL
jgi:hypothetical protein